jgi:hypothetical protein
MYVAGQRLSKNVTAATNTQATMKELLDMSLSMRSVSYQRKIGFSQNFLLYVDVDGTYR